MSTWIKKIVCLMVMLGGLGSLPMSAQLAVPPPSPVYQPLSAQELDQLLGPIALYPDPLVAQILPASTLPTQIVMADRYVSSGGNPNEADQQPWDASVQALVHYPDVLKYMDNNLNWTIDLGQAFLYQQQDVMDSIQRLRLSAYNLGNLRSTPQMQVIDDGGLIEILPVDTVVIYVPVYVPDEVYYQAGFGLSFGGGYPIGLWLDCDFDWHHHDLVVWSHEHPRPANWWHERPDRRVAEMSHHPTIWRPENHHGVEDANRGDRGWNNQPAEHARAPITNHPEARPPQVHTVTTVGTHTNTPRPVASPRSAAEDHHPAPVPEQRNEPVNRPASTGAFIGIQSSEQTRAFSNRGQQSMRPVTHSAPVSHPAPSSGGGGGNHNHDSRSKH